MNAFEGQKILTAKCKQGLWYQYGCALPTACFGALIFIAILSGRPEGKSSAVFMITGITFLVCLVAAISIFYYGIRLRKNAAVYKKIFPLVVYEKKTSIDEIAAFIGETIQTTLDATSRMVDFGIFPGCYVDNMGRQILNHERNDTTVLSTTDGDAANVAEVICTGCGASISPTSGVCEFCGAPLPKEV